MNNTAKARFWNLVDTSGKCWEWQGSTIFGYGSFGFNGRTVRAHRFSYSLVYGSIPEGMLVCHHCDNPRCVRLSHLFLGTQADNIHDAIAKGRINTQGENHGLSKLRENDVYEIRRLHSLGITQILLSKMWKIHRGYVTRIVRRKCWKHI